MSEAAVWYWNQKGKAQGPFSFDQLKTFVAQGELRGHELVFMEGATEWRRASEWSELSELFHDDGGGQFTKFIKLPEEERTVIRSDSKPAEDKWVLLIRIEEDKEIRFKQKGPYPTDEIKRYLREGKVSHSDHIWKKGAPKWIPISDVPEFHVNQLNVTEEVKDLLKEVTQMPRMVEVKAESSSVTPKVETSLETSAERKIEVKPVVPLGGSSEPKIDTKPAMIPVIPHIVPAGGSAANAHPRVESFGSVEAQVVSPTEEETGLRDLKNYQDEKTEIAGLEAQADTQVYRREVNDVEASADLEREPTQIVRIPLRVEPRAEPRHPQTHVKPVDEGGNARSWLSRLAPTLSFLLLAFMGLGIWATLKTRSPILTADRPVAVQDKPAPPAAPSEVGAMPKVEVKPVVAAAPEPEPEEEIFDREIAETEPVVEIKAPPVKNERKKYGAAAKTSVKEVKEVKESKESRDIADLPNISSEPKSTTLRVNSKSGFFEIIGSFRRGELIEIRINGNSGSILDLPALHQRLEVRATRNFVHRLSLNDLRVPRGIYQFSVKWGSSRSSKKLAWGGERGQLEPALVLHRKQIVFDQQQEKKKIVRALRDFGALLGRAEQEAGKGNLKAVQKDLTEKMPAEVKIVRLSRHELIYNDQWEKLANQWERLQAMVKEGGRGPASVSEISKAKKAISILEADMRNQSVSESQKN